MPGGQGLGVVGVWILAQVPSGCLMLPKGQDRVVGCSQLPSGLRIVPKAHGRVVITEDVVDSRIKIEYHN